MPKPRTGTVPRKKFLSVKRLLLRDPTIPWKEAKKILSKRGITVEPWYLSETRVKLNKEGLITTGKHTRLGKLMTRTTKIRKALFHSKGKKTYREIAKETRTSIWTVKEVAADMRKKGIEIKIRHQSEQIPKLSAKQKKILQNSRGIVESAFSTNVIKHGLNMKEIKDLTSDINERLPGWIVAYAEKKGKKMSLKDWIFSKIGYIARKIVRDR